MSVQQEKVIMTILLVKHISNGIFLNHNYGEFKPQEYENYVTTVSDAGDSEKIWIFPAALVKPMSFWLSAQMLYHWATDLWESWVMWQTWYTMYTDCK